MLYRSLWTGAAVLALSITALSAQEKKLNCNDGNNYSRDDRFRFCEVREVTTSALPKFRIEPGMNGGVSVKGWTRGEVLIRAKVEAAARSQGDADALGRQVQIRTTGGEITASGPEMRDRENWSVSFEVFVPTRTDLDVKAHNGGINLSDLRGDITFRTANGGVNLTRLAGNVTGETTNGGLNVDLDGSRWEGGELDVKTVNGGVNLNVPQNFAARLETGTVNGRVKIELPHSSPDRGMEGNAGGSYRGDINGGGPLVRVQTTNGGVNVRRKS